jgi:membrane-associated protein
MEEFLNYICQHADYAYLIIFGMLMLAGLNIPFSEDLLLLTAGAIASTCLAGHWLHLYLWVFFGCWFSAWEAYWIGRSLGPKLYNIKWFNRILTRKRIEKLHYYYEKFGIFTFIVGRFCPGGVRNALFMSSGLGKMPFLIFIARDGFACVLSSSTLFYIGYFFGENYKTLLRYFKTYQEILLGIIIFIIAIIIGLVWSKSRIKTLSL